jgi:DtxR family Mn-dependent transcriptional regulator
MEHLSIAMEHYLETVYELSAAQQGCRVSDIAAQLQVSKASAHSAMDVLSAKGLVQNEKYRQVVLTDEGLRLARLLSQKHAILQCLLTRVVGVDPLLANEDACAIEHVISTETVQAISDFLSAQGLSLPAEEL